MRRWDGECYSQMVQTSKEEEFLNMSGKVMVFDCFFSCQQSFIASSLFRIHINHSLCSEEFVLSLEK